MLKIQQDAAKFETSRVNPLVFPPFEGTQDIIVHTLLQGHAVFMAVHWKPATQTAVRIN